MNLIGPHRQKHLSHAAQFAKSGKDLVDRLLKPQIRIEIEPVCTENLIRIDDAMESAKLAE